jgi:site-specific DNA-cytosine methylase
MSQDRRLKKIKSIRNGRPARVIDLFAGCGGFSLGFATAGFDIVGAVESDPLAAKSHTLNFCNALDTRQSEAHCTHRNIVSAELFENLRTMVHKTALQGLESGRQIYNPPF